MNLTIEDQAMTAEEVADFLHISESTVYRWIAGKLRDTPPLPARRIGRRLIIMKSDALACFNPPDAVNNKSTLTDTESPKA